MKSLTLKQAAAEINVSERMLSDISRRVGTWAEYRDGIAQEINDHGADCGFSGFIYHYETAAFFRGHSDEIMVMLRDLASDVGQTPAEMVAGFNCLSGVVDRDTVAAVLAFGRANDDGRAVVQNALAWFALETVSARLVDYMERL